MRLQVLAATALLSATVPWSEAGAAEVLPGPISARVVRVVDGDTIVVRARIWLGQDVEIHVRLDGIDTPEIKGNCAEERALAQEARRRVEARLAGRAAVLRDVRYGKFAGRVVARVFAEDGGDVAAELRASGLAHAYAGGRRAEWCERAAAE